jgi:predicted nucleic acid-binding protein
MIHVDTSVLVDALSGPKRSASLLRGVISGPQPVSISSIVLFEWLRGPRAKEETDAQEALFPNTNAVQFGSAEAEVAAKLYKKVKRARGREGDLAIAACALTHDAFLWTLNPRDFRDVPGLRLLKPPILGDDSDA